MRKNKIRSDALDQIFTQTFPKHDEMVSVFKGNVLGSGDLER